MPLASQICLAHDSRITNRQAATYLTTVPGKDMTVCPCSESKLKMKEALKEKYLGPLNPSVKKIAAGMLQLDLSWPETHSDTVQHDCAYTLDRSNAVAACLIPAVG